MIIIRIYIEVFMIDCWFSVSKGQKLNSITQNSYNHAPPPPLFLIRSHEKARCVMR
jgi:hypothetical protein